MTEPLPDYFRENLDGSVDYYDSRAGLYYPENDLPPPKRQESEMEDEPA